MAVHEKTTKIEIKNDDGYTKICIRCNKRYEAFESLIGKPREIELELCKPCLGTTQILQARRTAKLQADWRLKDERKRLRKKEWNKNAYLKEKNLV